LGISSGIISSKKRVRSYKVYIFLIRTTSRVDLAMSVSPPVRMNAVILETIKAGILG